MKCSEWMWREHGACGWPKKTFVAGMEVLPADAPEFHPQTRFPRYPRREAAREYHRRHQSDWGAYLVHQGFGDYLSSASPNDSSTPSSSSSSSHHGTRRISTTSIETSDTTGAGTTSANGRTASSSSGELLPRQLPAAIRELVRLLYPGSDSSAGAGTATATATGESGGTPAAPAPPAAPATTGFYDFKDIKENLKVFRRTKAQYPMGLSAAEIGEPNIYPLQECDPRGRIPTAVQGKWCLADYIDKFDVNGDPKLPFYAGNLTLRTSNDVGERRFADADKEYPLNNICLPHLPSDFCHFSQHRDYLPGTWRHAFVKTEKAWYEPDLPLPPILTPQELAHTAPFGHGKMLHEKARMLAGSVDPLYPSHKRVQDNSLVTQAERTIAETKLELSQKDGADDVEAVANNFHSAAPNIGGSNPETMRAGDGRPSGAMLKFWVANPDSMYVSSSIVNNLNIKLQKYMDPQNVIAKARSLYYGAISSGAKKVWQPPDLVFDEGEDCCGDGCSEFVGKPYCVTEAEIRRYFEQTDHVPPPDLINCAASDTQICDSLHGDARDTDDHWGLGWLDAMRRWNAVHEPMPPRDQIQKERKTLLLSTPGDIDLVGMKKDPVGTVVNMLKPPKTPQPAPDYVPPDYDATANTSSYAVFSVTGQPIPMDMPSGYRTEEVEEEALRWNAERTGSDIHGMRPEIM